MPKTMPANEVKNRFESALKYVREENDEVIVENDGEPRAVIMSIAGFEEVQELREQKRRADALERLYAIREERKRNGTFSIPSVATPEQRAEAWARLEALREEVSAQNRDLTEEQIEEIANRMSRDMIDHMAATGKLVFERDLPPESR